MDDYTADQDSQKNRYMVFLIANEIYGIEIKYIREIVGLQNITEMPEMPEYIKGIINLRGNIIPVMDIRLRFKKEAKEYDDRTCVIVVDFDGINIGLVVDSVSEVLTLPEEDVIEPPKVNSDYDNKHLKSIGKRGQSVILILDCGHLILADGLLQLNTTP